MDEDVAAFWATRRPDGPPERGLFVAVILLAIEDATKRCGEIQRDAVEWLEYSEDFMLVAQLAGYDDPELVRGRIVARIDEKARREAIKVPLMPDYAQGGKTLLTGVMC